MSASRDQSQKIAFVYSNLYSLYQKGKSAAKEAEVPVTDAAPVAAALWHPSSFAPAPAERPPAGAR